jgi:hypothetical protein
MLIGGPVPHTGDGGGFQAYGGIAPAQEEPFDTVALASRHNVAGFRCANSERVSNFLKDDYPKLAGVRFCRAFIYENPDDSSDVWGFYTLSASLIERASLSHTDRKRLLHSSCPVTRIGFLGRSDSSPKGLGAGLLEDAAKRIARADIASWGIVLHPEGGTDNTKLYSWYTNRGFKLRTGKEGELPEMYAPLSAFLPPDFEL